MEFIQDFAESFGIKVSPFLLYSTLCLVSLTTFFSFVTAIKHSYWKNQGIDGPTTLPFIGNIFDMLFSPLLTRLCERHAKYGEVYGTYQGNEPQLVLSDPEMIKNVLIRDWQVFADRTGVSRSGTPTTDNFLTNLSGNDWKRMRTVMSPTFTSGKMKIMFNIMNECCENITKNIRKNIDSNLDIRHLAGCYSMDVIAKCCFATETNSFDDPNNVFVAAAKRFFQVPKARLIFTFLCPVWLRKHLRIAVFSRESLGFFEHVSRTLLEQRTKADANSNGYKKKNDYLQLLIDASNEDFNSSSKQDTITVDNESHHGYEDKLSDKVINNNEDAKNKNVKRMSTDEIISNSVLFLAVGYDTTSTLITFTTYLLACNEDKQQILYQEIRDAYESNDNTFNYEVISGMKYLDATISESLRLKGSI